MKKFAYNKIVRDKVFDSMVEIDDNVSYRILSGEEYLQALKAKILEEASEIDLSNKEATAKELADIQEVIDSIIAALGKTTEDISKLQVDKNEKSGSFTKKIYIESVEISDDHPWMKYLQENPDRYPEIK